MVPRVGYLVDRRAGSPIGAHDEIDAGQIVEHVVNRCTGELTADVTRESGYLISRAVAAGSLEANRIVILGVPERCTASDNSGVT